MCNALPRLFGSVAVLTTPLGSFSAYSLSLAMSVSFQIWTGEVLLLVNGPHIIRNLEQFPRRSYRINYLCALLETPPSSLCPRARSYHGEDYTDIADLADLHVSLKRPHHEQHSHR